MVRLIRLSGIHTVSVNVNSNESTVALTFQFWLIQRVTKRQFTDTVLPCTVATIVWGTVWHIGSALLFYDSWTSRRLGGELFFQKADITWILIGCMDQDGLVHVVGGFARFSHFKTTRWVNHWCEKFDCRCKWLICVNSFRCMTPNHWLVCPLRILLFFQLHEKYTLHIFYYKFIRENKWLSLLHFLYMSGLWCEPRWNHFIQECAELSEINFDTSS